MKIKIIYSLILCLFTAKFYSQENGIKWKPAVKEPVEFSNLFHSVESINLPTATTISKGDFQFEISHRFLPRISDGYESLYGFDGPVNIRLGLSYAITDDLMTRLMRSNVDDNLELRFKYKIVSHTFGSIPFSAAIAFAGVWNSGRIGSKPEGASDYQYYGQLVLNTLISKKLGIGVVPSFLYNTSIYTADQKTSFTFGTYFQYYISGMFSLMAEWNPTVTGYRNRHDSFSFGFEIETGGHFFKIIATNNSNLNPSQFIAGADLYSSAKNLRIGFNITRLLRF